MLFQMCYGPEIKTVFDCIQREPHQSVESLKIKFQYQTEGDISSLIDGVLIFLKELEFIEQKKGLYTTIQSQWNTIEVFKKIKNIQQTTPEDTLNYVFSSIYDQLFVKPDKLFMVNIHYHINNKYEKTLVGQEKINAWKRIMECFGLGRRVYSGFYALPQIHLLKLLLSHIGPWEGPLHQFCEEKVDKILPCITSEGNIYSGLLYGLAFLNENRHIEISNKQDLPYKSYGYDRSWNWIHV
jgi:hypothetical protein